MSVEGRVTRDEGFGPALFDLETVRMDSPRLRAIKEHEIQTHHAPHMTDAPWLAVPMKAAREALQGYNLTREEETTVAGIMAGYCRLLCDMGMTFYAGTERDAQDDALAWCEAEERRARGAFVPVLNPPRLWFGTGFPTALPAGWVLVESPDEFARAIDPAGQKYFLGLEAAFPQRVATEPRGALKPGDVYLDSECGVVPLIGRPAEGPDGCKCSLRERLVGDGCDVCNPEYAAEVRGEGEANEKGQP